MLKAVESGSGLVGRRGLFRGGVVGLNGGGNPIAQSLLFDGTNYLSMSSTDWGAYDRSQFAIAGAFRVDVASGNQRIFGKRGAVGAREFSIFVQNGINLWAAWDLDSGTSESHRAASVITAETWYAFLIHYDGDNATPELRSRMWINGTEVGALSGAISGAIKATATEVRIASDVGNPDQPFAGEVYSLALFSGALPDATDVFDGTEGKLKDLSGLAGIYSLLDVDGGDVTSDDTRGTDWTNTNDVTASAEIP